jgi:hypothetical protein
MGSAFGFLRAFVSVGFVARAGRFDGRQATRALKCPDRHEDAEAAPGGTSPLTRVDQQKMPP